VLKDFHVEYNVVSVSRPHGVRARIGALVTHVEPGVVGVFPRDRDAFFDNVYAMHMGSKSGHGFAQKSAATADVKDAKPR
jgi:hypothetical protein